MSTAVAEMPRATRALNEEQARAVALEPGPVLVLAGAGTGKTRVLTHRIAHVLQGRHDPGDVGAPGCKPGRIFAATFTNKAAGQMRERVAALLDFAPEDLGSLWIGTFHGLCARLLREFPEDFGLDADVGFTIYTEQDQHSVLQGILDDLGVQLKVAEAASYISAVKNEVITPETPVSKGQQAQLGVLLQVRQRYDRLLAESNALDFDDLVGVVRASLRDCPGTRAFCRQLFDHVLIDEFQDTNPAQYDIARALAEQHGSLFVVGDDDQSIYAFRGARVGNILRFPEDYAAARVVRMEQNYRSGERILQAANAAVANNQGRHGKKLWTDRKGEGVLYGIEYPSPLREAHAVVRQIKGLLERDGYDWGDVAVLYRSNAQGDVLEQVCRWAKVPFVRLVRSRRYSGDDLRPLLLLLRLAVNPHDEVAARELRAHPDGEGHLAAVESVRDDMAELSAPAAIRRALELTDRFGPVQDAEADGTVDAQEGEALARLLDGAARFAEEPEDDSLAAFLHQASLLAMEAESGQDGVQLMTIHGAKGLEFPVVFVVGLEEGTFPSLRVLEEATRHPEVLEEERRLFHVALTRAQRQVVLSFSTERSGMEGTVCTAPSRFLGEVPDHLIRKVRLPGCQADRADWADRAGAPSTQSPLLTR